MENLSSATKLGGSNTTGICGIPNTEGPYCPNAKAAGKLVTQAEPVLVEYYSGIMVGLR